MAKSARLAKLHLDGALTSERPANTIASTRK
jgi:hypothetical protein